jgi:hypothetical protein
MREAADRGIGFDICLISNMRLGATPSLEEHPITSFVAAGISCSVSSNDPALLDTNLERDHAAARSLGLTPKQLYDASTSWCPLRRRNKTRATPTRGLPQLVPTRRWRGLRSPAPQVVRRPRSAEEREESVCLV